MTNLKQSATILKSIGNLSRLQIVNFLLTGEKSVNALLDDLADADNNISQPALSQHLSRLKKSGVLACRRDGRNIWYYIANPRIIGVLGSVAEMADDAKTA